MLAFSLPAQAQILYTTYNGSTFQLRQVNGDGTGDTAVATPFANLSFPVWSRDRALIALTAKDPARPSQISLNAYTFNPVTGAIQNVTNFQDSLGTSYSVEYAYHKAFSPNRQFLAVNSVIASGNQNGSSDTPILQIYAADGSGGSLATVHIGPIKDGIHHDGEGITWSPTQNLLATPVKIDTPLQSGGGKGETTAIFLAEPVTNAGNARQLTFPRADQVATPTQGYIYGEHDYQPKFSPNGVGVAYVRSFQIAYTSNGGVPSPDVQSLHIVNVNTGADTLVLQLQQNQYVTTLDWSPDGTALVFDAGQEYSNSGIPGQAVQPGTDQVFVVNVDGSGLRQLRGAGSGMPSWAPNALPGAAVQVSTRLSAGAGDNSLTVGFIIQGAGAKKVLIRGIGTSLKPFFGDRALIDPTLTLRNQQTGELLGTNNNWRTTQTGGVIAGDQSAEIQASGLAPTQDAESVIIATLPPGQYTAEVKGAGGGTGFALAEIYDRETTSGTFLANISTRGLVQTDDNIMISGLFVANQNTRIVFRALGPTLADVGVPGAMADPTLDLVDPNGTMVASNNNWQEAANANDLPAYLRPAHPSESVILASLTPNRYTVQLRGVNRTTGNALIESYVLK